jgi:hypothetical protein
MDEHEIYSDLTEFTKVPKENLTSLLDTVLIEQEIGGNAHHSSSIPIVNCSKEQTKHRIRAILRENQKLRQENVILRKNISILFKTAQSELERKQRELQEYRQRFSNS